MLKQILQSEIFWWSVITVVWRLSGSFRNVWICVYICSSVCYLRTKLLPLLYCLIFRSVIPFFFFSTHFHLNWTDTVVRQPFNPVWFLQIRAHSAECFSHDGPRSENLPQHSCRFWPRKEFPRKRRFCCCFPQLWAEKSPRNVARNATSLPARVCQWNLCDLWVFLPF